MTPGGTSEQRQMFDVTNVINLLFSKRCGGSPCNDDMVIITCAGKWKISRKYGGICGQGEGRMKRIVDKGLLLAGGLLYGGTVGKACSAGHSVAVGDDCGGIWQLCGQQTMALYCALQGCLRSALSCRNSVFVPVLLYDCAEKGDAALVLSVPGLAFFLSGTDYPAALLWAADGMLIVAAILLACRTGRILYLEQEMIRLRDTSTELNLVLQEKTRT